MQMMSFYELSRVQPFHFSGRMIRSFAKQCLRYGGTRQLGSFGKNRNLSSHVLGFSTVIMSGYAAYTIADPTNVFALRQANAETSILLQKSDSFVQYASKIASQVGVRSAENLEIRLSQQNAGASLGTNLKKACIILPLDLYTAFHSSLSDSVDTDLPSPAELDFVIAHESAHIADSHMVISRVAFPISLFGAYSIMGKIPNKWVAAMVGCATLLLTNIFVSRQIEYRADAIAAKAGYGYGGVVLFKRSQVRNCRVRELTKSRMITKRGDYLGDIMHPLLTSRIKRLLAQSYMPHIQPASSALIFEVVRSCQNDGALAFTQ